MSKQRIFIAGHRGMVGSAIRRQLEQRGDVELVLRTRDELNLLDSRAVHDFFASERIDQVYLAAAKVGGIVANNTYPADFIYQNMMIESNIIHAAHLHNVNKLLFLGSLCGMGVLYLLFLFLLGCLDKRMLSLLLGKKTGGR